MNAPGVIQTDLLIRTGITAALKDLRANPWLLEACFNFYIQDEFTAQEYGKKHRDEAIKFIQKHDIPVYQNTKVDDPLPPCIVINLVESAEVDNTLADVHHQTSEPVDSWPILYGPLTPSFNPATAELTLPKNLRDASIYPGMVVFDRVGTGHVIEGVAELNDHLVLTLATGTRADFTGAVIKSGSPATSISLQGIACRESFMLGVHATEPGHLLHLHSALVFLLWYYRKTYFEARGFEISTVSSSDFHRNTAVSIQNCYERFVTLSGKVRHVIPGGQFQRIDGIQFRSMKVIGGETLPLEFDPRTALWTGDEDSVI